MASATRPGSLMTPLGRQSGMIYIALLLAVALIGGVSAAGLRVAQTVQARQTEAELIEVGLAYRNALQSYAEATPNGMPGTPESLADLLRDPRYPTLRRHLRRLYADPLTGKADWIIERGPDRRIVGIRSTSNRETLKRDGFPPALAALAGKSRYDEWVFSMAMPANNPVGQPNGK